MVENTHRRPPLSSGTVAAFGATSPPVKFTVETTGRVGAAVPHREVAAALLADDGEVGTDGVGSGGHAAATADLEGLGDAGLETGGADALTGVDHAGGHERLEADAGPEGDGGRCRGGRAEGGGRVDGEAPRDRAGLARDGDRVGARGQRVARDRDDRVVGGEDRLRGAVGVRAADRPQVSSTPVGPVTVVVTLPLTASGMRAITGRPVGWLVLHPQ